METHVLTQQDISFDFIKTTEKVEERLEKTGEVIKADAAEQEEVQEMRNENRNLISKSFPKPGSSSYLTNLIKGKVPGQRQHWFWET